MKVKTKQGQEVLWWHFEWHHIANNHKLVHHGFFHLFVDNKLSTEYVRDCVTFVHKLSEWPTKKDYALSQGM